MINPILKAILLVSATAFCGIQWQQQVSNTTAAIYSIVYADNQYIAVGPGGISNSPDGKTWTTTYVDPALLSSVAWGHAMAVAVGWEGKISTSSDGKKWTDRSSGTEGGLFGITWTGSQWIAVGFDDVDNVGIVSASPDGIAWTTQKLGFPEDLWAVAASPSLIVAGGGGGRIATSKDGITWTAGNAGFGTRINSITWSGSVFVAVTMDGFILTSTDGSSWEPTYTTSGGMALMSVYRKGNSLLAVGDAGSILSSTDARVWNLDTLSGRWGWGGLLRSVASHGDQVVIVGNSGNIFTSDAWTVPIISRHGSASGTDRNRSIWKNQGNALRFNRVESGVSEYFNLSGRKLPSIFP